MFFLLFFWKAINWLQEDKIIIIFNFFIFLVKKVHTYKYLIIKKVEVENTKLWK